MTELYIGLISGTSMDAVDAALLETGRGRPRLLATHAEPPPEALRADLIGLSEDVAGVSLRKLGELHQRTGQWFAGAATRLMEDAKLDPGTVRAIGSHGQTLYHAPEHVPPFSLQIGDPNLIAACTGIPTVAYFRQADMAAGGQGAPLVPAFHHAVFTSDDESRCVVNIGGIANITLLPAAADAASVAGFDTGPGNALLDSWIAEHLGQSQDTDARWAARGKLDQTLLGLMLQDRYFQRPPPKSTGRETFNLDWIRKQAALLDYPPDPASVQRTLVELTAHTIADDIDKHSGGVERVLICGGGSRNPLLRERLTELLAPCPVEDTRAYGVDVDWVEAAAVAWLAMRTVKGLPGNLPSVTGARQAVVLGGVYAPYGTRDSRSN